MDTLLRRRRFFLIAIVAPFIGASVTSCGASRANSSPVGVSTASDGRGRAAPVASASPLHRSNAIPLDYKTTMSHVGSGRFVSRGHASGRFDSELYATESARGAFTTANGEFPVGSRFVEAHYEKASSPTPLDEAPGPLFMMEKMQKGFDADHGDWRFVALSSTGNLVQEGKIESCGGCHEDAPHDHVFPAD